ncbi:MAG: hypothetical protein NTV48_03275 [Candidatus Vogelbacteria bacterium]|nr:hypothetical protein [Candidatus Vogelbacteria bacterium]
MEKETNLNIKPKEITKKLLEQLPERSRDVLTKRYGLGKNTTRMTLEAIGGEYKITRERVRQIENFGLNLVKKSKAFSITLPTFNQLKKLLDSCGGIVHEQDFLDSLFKDKSSQNHLHFLMVISDAFTKIREDEDFHHRWTTNPDLADKVHVSLKNLCQKFTANDLVSEPELISRFIAELKEVSDDPKLESFATRWLAISKSLAKNPLGEWGLSSSPNVRMRGIRDYAYLVLRQVKEPLHFGEVSKKIAKVFGKKAHSATCHNELIKDDRFVLVGRGLYALTEWGYTKGTVVEVIKKILAEGGSLSREEIIKRVLKERKVKENTVLVNLQNGDYFKKDKDGNYVLV